MKARSRQISQRLAARLKFFCCITQVSQYINYSPVKLRRAPRLMKVWEPLVGVFDNKRLGGGRRCGWSVFSPPPGLTVSVLTSLLALRPKIKIIVVDVFGSYAYRPKLAIRNRQLSDELRPNIWAVDISSLGTYVRETIEFIRSEIITSSTEVGVVCQRGCVRPRNTYKRNFLHTFLEKRSSCFNLLCAVSLPKTLWSVKW